MNLYEKDNFSKFGKHFQENLTQLILEERTFCDQMQEVLDVNFLELKYLQILVDMTRHTLMRRKLISIPDFRWFSTLHPRCWLRSSHWRARTDLVRPSG